MEEFNKKTRRAAEGFFLPSAVCGVCGTLITFLLALIFSAAAVRSADPSAMLTPLSLAAIALGAFAASFAAAHRAKDNIFPAAAVSALPTLLITLGATLISPRGDGIVPVLFNVGTLAAATAAGALSARSLKRKKTPAAVRSAAGRTRRK